MQDSSTISLATASVALLLVAALSVPALAQFIKRYTSSKLQYKDLSDRYEDEDGIATEESESAYSDFIPRLIVLLVSLVGTLDCLVSAVLTSTRAVLPLTVEQWLQCATWGFILFQAVIVFTNPSSNQRYLLGIYGGLSCLLLTIAIPVENFSLWFANAIPPPRNIHVSLSIIQFAATVILVFANLSIPRRPDVYRNDKVVDRQNTGSALGKITFSWPTSLLYYAATHKGLGYDDLPEVANETRSKTLKTRFEAVGKKDALWKSIVWSHKSAFIAQWTLQVITSITNFLPQIALLYILRSLEARDAGEKTAFLSWVLVICLGLSVTISSWLESWLFFIVFMKLGVPIYEQLSAVVFGKALRRKDVKSTGKKKEADDQLVISKDSVINGEITAVEAGEDDENEDLQKTRQSTINLVGVDSKRIADFATFNYLFLGSVIKMVFALGFLAKLIGPIPLLAGLAVPICITPLNYLTAKQYADAQDDLMKVRDQKMAVITEALQGIRQIKFSALEKSWYEKILEMRRKELKTQWKVFVFDTLLISIWIFLPVTLAAVSLSTYAVINKRLTASIAFTTISVFEAIEVSLAVLPEMVTAYLDAKVSAGRVQEYLDSPEREETTKPGPTVSFSEATVGWPSDDPEGDEDKFRLRSLNITFPAKELSVISGKTGSGKSLLLASIIGEADILGGSVHVPRAPPAHERYDSKATRNDWYISSSIAFVAQIPWIENATIRDNILFSLPYDSVRYKKVLHACALEKDLEMLQDGEMTDIGANGINLSGGQKWRVSFARALYSRAGILVLDDIFSAVDANVGRHLFEEALTGELGQGRTRILVTHHVALCLPRTTYSVLLGDGTAQQAGATEQLRKSGQLKAILAHDIEEQHKEEEEADKGAALTIDDGGGSLQTMLSNRSRRISALSDVGEDISRRRSHAGEADGKQNLSPKKFTEEEKRETGAIKYQIYAEYIRASGGFGYWAFVMLLFAIAIVVYLGRQFWISVWTRSYRTEDVLPLHLTTQGTTIFRHIRSEFEAVDIDPNLWYYLSVYVALSLGTWVIGTGRYFSIFVASIRASKTLFERLTFAILRAPLRFLDTTPLGRILNRFTSDFNMLDSRVSNDLAFMLHNAMQVLEVVVAGIAVSPFMLVFAAALLAISFYYALRYLAGAREVKRLESNAKSPVFEQFGSVLTGIATIRAFDKADEYIDRMYAKIDKHCVAYWHLWLFNRWMGFRLNMVGAIFATITAALIVSITTIDASLAGFALSFSLGLSESVIWMLRQYANVEIDMNATERIMEYSNNPIEDQGGVDAPAAWPTEGRLEVSDLVVGYAPDLPPVLKGLTFGVERNQRIGVVGRTGAGKSSLTMALFRFLEPREGSIYIDGIDVSKIKLHDLRSRLAIIPQDPVLFSGTVRTNLDAFNQHSDTELRDALARVHLISTPSAGPSGAATPVQTTADHDPNTNTNVFKSLSSKISEGGLNLSQGQRQLLCLARAIVLRRRILILDEATSAVDMETDAVIQRSIREEFDDATLIVIAHRLSTIADFDRILVMGDGRVLEYDEPGVLMRKEGGEFRKMVEESGERRELEEVIRASGK